MNANLTQTAVFERGIKLHARIESCTTARFFPKHPPSGHTRRALESAQVISGSLSCRVVWVLLFVMFAMLGAVRVHAQTAYTSRLASNARQSVAVTGIQITGDDIRNSTAFTSGPRQDLPGLKVSPATLSVNEGDPAGATYTVSLRIQLSRTINVNVSGLSGTDVSTDKTMLTFTPETWDIPQTVTVTAREDVDAVDDEVTLTHFVPVGPPGLGRGALRVTVIDDETPSTAIELSSDTTTVAESGGEHTVTVNAAFDAAPVTRDTLLRVDVDSGTADRLFDFRTVDPFTVLIPAGQTSVTGTFTLVPVNDDIDEGDETVAIGGVFVRGPTEAALPIEGTSVTITDDDTRGVIIGESALSIQQGRGASYEIVLTSRPTESVTVEVIAPQVDGLILPQDPFVFGMPFWNIPKTVRLRVREDAAVPNEPVILTHRVSGGDYEGLSAGSVAVTIVERVLPTITVEDARASEESDALEFEVSLDSASNEQVRVNYGTFGGFLNDPEVGKATNNRDYRGKSGELVFAAGDRRKRVRVNLIEDDVHEGEETFTFTLSNPRNARLPDDELSLRVQGIIEDDDPQPTVTLALSDPSIPENGGQVTVTATLDHLSSVETTVTVSVAPATASDVTLGSNTTLTITARNFSSPGTVMITANDNDVDAPDKTLRIEGIATNAAGVTDPSSLALTIEDDDTQVVIIPDDDLPVITLEADVEEVIYNLPQDVFDHDDVSFTVTRMGSIEEALDVAVTLTQDRPFLPTGALSRIVTIASGVASAKLRIAQSEFTGSADADGTLTATVADGDTYVVGTSATANVRMKFVNPAVTVALEKSAYRFPEDQGTAEIVLVAETAPGVPAPSPSSSFFVTVSTRAGEATSPEDYSAVSALSEIAGEWTAAGDRFTVRKTLDVLMIHDDAIEEPDESLGLLLERAPSTEEWVDFALPDGAPCGVACRSTVTIEDNDTAVTVGADVEEVIYNLPQDVFDLDDVSFTVTRMGSTEEALDVAVTLTQDRPFLPTGALSRIVTIPAGAALAKLGIAQSEFTGAAAADGTLTATVANTNATASVRMKFVNPAVTVALEKSAYRFSEGHGTAEFAVVAETAPGVPAPSPSWSFSVSVSTRAGEATSPEDYGAVSVLSEIAGEWTATGDRFTVRKALDVLMIHDDAIEEPDESLGLLLEQVPGREEWVGFALPDGVPCGISNPGTTCRSTVTIEDNDTAGVTVSPTALAVTEEDTVGATYTVVLTAKPTNAVTVTVTGTADTDVTVNPSNLTFTTENWATAQPLTVTARADDDAGNEIVTLEHLATGGGYDEVEIADVMVTIEDNDEAGPTAVTVSYGSSLYTTTEGGRAATVAVTLSADPERQVVVPITAMNRGGATSGDYSGIPASVTFESGDTSRRFTVTATDDSIDDDGESVTLGFGALPTRVRPGTNNEATVTIEDNDEAGPTAVTVSYGSSLYTTTEGGRAATVAVTLSADPERQVVVPITAMNRGGATSGDYSGIPASVTFESGDTSRRFTVTATDDSIDDDGESVTLGFGALPTRVRPGTNNEATVTIEDNDEAGPTAVTVSYGSSLYTTTEGGRAATVAVTLSADPERQVVVPITATNRGGATSGDYSGIPASVTFESGDTSRRFTVTATDDSIDDDGESVTLGFGALPTRVRPGTNNEATVTIEDNDEAGPTAVTVSYGSSLYTTTEGGRAATVAVTLSADPERQVVVPITATNRGGATSGDYSGIPASVTFESGDTSRRFTVTATDDSIDDDGESVTLGFGALPTGVSVGTTKVATVAITDDDDPPVTVSYGASTYTAMEGGAAATVTVTLSADLERQVVVSITAMNHGGVTSEDYSGVPANVTFQSGDTSRRFTVIATDDSIDDDGESITLGFVALPTRVRAGTSNEATVTLEDNDAVPEITVSDARALESSGEIVLETRMSRASNRPVTLRYVTADGTAKVDKDYIGERAILTFPPGETIQIITVPVLDDTLDEDNETFAVLLSDARNATLADAEATGTIIDNDQSVAKAWLARLARTVTSHMLDAVGGRLTQPFQPGLHVTIGGQPVNFDDARSSAGRGFDAKSAKSYDELRREWDDPRIQPRTLSVNELLLGSAFSWSASADSGTGGVARWTAWGRGAATRFAGAEGDVSLDGNVTTGTVGADYEWGRLLAGLAVSHSVGNGGFDVRGAVHRPESVDELESSLTSVQPYLRYQMNERVAAWALLGYGQGNLALTQENTRMTTGIEMSMGMAGVRGALLSASETDGFDLAVRSDVFLTRIRSDAATDLAAAEADVSRVRLLLEGSHTRMLASGGVLTPSLQIGLRYDDGDAETGTGLELGTGLRYTDPTWGLMVEVSGRGLLAHEESDYEEWGVGGSIRLDPGPYGLGPSLTFTTSFGEASSGAEALWTRETMAGLASNGGQASGGRIDIELGYGLAVSSGRGVGTPYARGSFSESGNSFLLGYKVGVGQDVALHVEGMRREPANANAVPESGIMVGCTLNW